MQTKIELKKLDDFPEIQAHPGFIFEDIRYQEEPTKNPYWISPIQGLWEMARSTWKSKKQTTTFWNSNTDKSFQELQPDEKLNWTYGFYQNQEGNQNQWKCTVQLEKPIDGKRYVIFDVTIQKHSEERSFEFNKKLVGDLDAGIRETLNTKLKELYLEEKKRLEKAVEETKEKLTDHCKNNGSINNEFQELQKLLGTLISTSKDQKADSDNKPYHYTDISEKTKKITSYLQQIQQKAEEAKTLQNRITEITDIIVFFEKNKIEFNPILPNIFKLHNLHRENSRNILITLESNTKISFPVVNYFNFIETIYKKAYLQPFKAAIRLFKSEVLREKILSLSYKALSKDSPTSKELAKSLYEALEEALQDFRDLGKTKQWFVGYHDWDEKGRYKKDPKSDYQIIHRIKDALNPDQARIKDNKGKTAEQILNHPDEKILYHFFKEYLNLEEIEEIKDEVHNRPK